MEIKSPCRVCRRINDDKRVCAAKCPALALYRKTIVECRIDSTNQLDKINKKLKKLADDYAGQFTEERTDSAEMIPENDEDGETFMADIEIDPDLSDESDIDKTQKPTGKQQKPSEDTKKKKRKKYTKKKDTLDDNAGTKVTNLSNAFKNITGLTKKSEVNGQEDLAKGMGVFLDMSKYTQVYKILEEISKKSMLPIEHIVISLVAKGLSSE